MTPLHRIEEQVPKNVMLELMCVVDIKVGPYVRIDGLGIQMFGGLIQYHSYEGLN